MIKNVERMELFPFKNGGFLVFATVVSCNNNDDSDIFLFIVTMTIESFSLSKS